jgi:thioredoxin-like negative regulator of GroEL
MQVAEDLGDEVAILKVNTEENTQLSSQLQIQGLPTMIFVGTDTEKPALRTEGLLPANTIKDIVMKELLAPSA